MAHRFSLRVYYSDTDAGGIVYHARYLDFAEHARTELLRQISHDRPGQADMMRERRVGYVVKSLSVEYHVPAFLDDELEVHTSVESAKRFSVTFLQRVMRAEAEVATLRVRVAAVDLVTLRPIAFEPWFAEAAGRL
jgi:acyl-CoA thioester hydrolase